MQALQPYISQQIMELHHKKHHQTYVNGLNAALEAQKKAAEANDVPKLVSVQQAIKFNGGGHINHSLFWKNLAPEKSGGGKIDQAPVLKAAIEQRWGSFDKFKDAFNTTLLGIQGSGWGWLVTDGPKGKLDITTTHDQDPVTGAAPVFGVDMWEHAYYLQVHLHSLRLLFFCSPCSFANESIVLERQSLVCQGHLERDQLG
jgi:Fe-Mn family superoxide dismutase